MPVTCKVRFDVLTIAVGWIAGSPSEASNWPLKPPSRTLFFFGQVAVAVPCVTGATVVVPRTSFRCFALPHYASEVRSPAPSLEFAPVAAHSRFDARSSPNVAIPGPDPKATSATQPPNATLPFVQRVVTVAS
jgi:hypothetical protein